MQTSDKLTNRHSTDIIVIGTGFSGLGVAVSLKREGRHNFIVLERADEVGGTWRDNTYPGAACDIPSHLYSFSFRQNPNWSNVYARQPEILEYLKQTADAEQLRPHIHFGQTVTKASWDEKAARWIIEAGDRVYEAKALVSAAGHLSDPAFPAIAGLADYKGKIFHSAQWDHDYDLSGKRVAVVGTGASSIQIVPELAKTAERLVVYQRSAPYVVPRRDAEYSVAEQRMFARVPKTAQHLRDEHFWFSEDRYLQRRRVSTFLTMVSGVALNHLASQVADDDLRRRLTPDYEIGCKRILISNDYFPALQKPNVRLDTAGITAVTADGIVSRDGKEETFDAIVLATGFEATDLPIAEHIFGRGARKLADQWDEGAKAYDCTSISGFPNLFMMLGPNTGLGAGSMVYMAETQAGYIHQALSHILENDIVIEPEARAEEEFVNDLYERSEGTVWVAGGCKSWYLHPKSQKLTALWPDFMHRFRIDNGKFSQEGYISQKNVASVIQDAPLERATS